MADERVWPPKVEDLMIDQGWSTEDLKTGDLEFYQTQLDAAVSFVERKRPLINYTGDLSSLNPEPDPDLFLGTIRLAARWVSRRRSPDATVSFGELGTGRVSAYDPDIERLLRIGRQSPPMVG